MSNIERAIQQTANAFDAETAELITQAFTRVVAAAKVLESIQQPDLFGWALREALADGYEEAEAIMAAGEIYTEWGQAG